MTRTFFLILLFNLVLNTSNSQKLDSIFIDRAVKTELLQQLEPSWLVKEGNLSIDEYHSYFQPAYLNNDTLVDMIYEGPSGAESYEVRIYLNEDGKLKLIKSELGSIGLINKTFPDTPAELHFSQYGCCDDPHNYFQIWTLINNQIMEGEKYHFLNETLIPEDFKYHFSIKVKNTPYKLRATPEIIENDFHYHYEHGNVIAEYSAGDIGHVLSKKQDETGRIWYFVAMNKPRTISYHNYMIYANERWLGWMSGRYVEILN